MQSEIEDIRLALKVLEILNGSQMGLGREDVADAVFLIRQDLDKIEAQQAVRRPDDMVSLPVMTLAQVAAAAARDTRRRLLGLGVIDGGRNG